MEAGVRTKLERGIVGAGSLLVLVGLFRLIPIFAIPVARDCPWVNLLMFAAGAALLSMGLVRAFAETRPVSGPDLGGSVLALLGVLGIGMFCWGVLVGGAAPARVGGGAAGRAAGAGFHPADQDGRPVTLAELVSSPRPRRPPPASGSTACCSSSTANTGDRFATPSCGVSSSVSPGSTPAASAWSRSASTRPTSAAPPRQARALVPDPRRSQAEVIRRYDLLHPAGGPGGSEHLRPRRVAGPTRPAPSAGST